MGFPTRYKFNTPQQSISNSRRSTKNCDFCENREFPKFHTPWGNRKTLINFSKILHFFYPHSTQYTTFPRYYVSKFQLAFFSQHPIYTCRGKLVKLLAIVTKMLCKLMQPKIIQPMHDPQSRLHQTM